MIEKPAKMIVKLWKDHLVKQSPTCGELREILTGPDYPFQNIALAVNIKPTQAHYHERFEEIYFVLDGATHLELYDPATARTWTEKLAANELCVISQGVHHVIRKASQPNRLCVITVPGFDASDEHWSDKI